MAKHHHQRTPRYSKGSRKEDHQRHEKKNDGDACHNRDRPCCTPLHELAQRLLAEEGAARGGDVTATPSSNNNSNTNGSQTGGGLLQLLLRDPSNNSAAKESAKKKRKKKKKKKSGTPTANNVGPTECDTPAGTEGESALSTKEGLAEETEVVTNGNVPNSTQQRTPATMAPQPTHDPVAQQQHRQRRVHRLVQQLLQRKGIIQQQPPPSSNGQSGTSSNNATHHRWAEFLATAATTPRIPHALIEQALDTVQCSHCRRDVQRYCRSASHPSSNTSMASLPGCTIGTIHDVMSKEDMEDQHAQYQLFMEEGMVPRSWILQRESVVGDGGNSKTNSKENGDDKGHWTIARSGSGVDNNEDASSSLHHLVVFLLEHYVLLQGLHPDTVVGTENISNYQDYASLGTTGRDNLAVLDREFQDMSQRVTSAFTRFQSTADHDKEQVHVSSFPTLQDVDSAYDGVWDSLLRIAFETTRRVFRVQSGYRSRCRGGGGGGDGTVDDDEWAANVHWVSSQCANMWQHAFLEPLHQQLFLLQEYEEQLSATADRLGGFRTMYADANSRTIFRKYVERKGIITCKALKKVQECLYYDTHVGGWSDANCGYSKTHFAHRLFMEDGLGQVEGGALQSSSLCFLDQAFEDVLTTLRELTETVHKPKVAVLAEENHRRFAKLSRLVQKANECLSDARDGADESKSEMNRLERGLQSTTSLLSPVNDRETNNAADDCMKRLRSTIVPCIQKSVASWVELHEHFSSAGDESNAIPLVPFEHRQRLVDALAQDCTGGNGSVRFHNVFVALWFEQLFRQFNEWSCRIAERELLTNFDDLEEPQRVPSSKKPKKKKARRAPSQKSSSVSAPSPPSTKETIDRSEGGDDSSDEDEADIVHPKPVPVSARSEKDEQSSFVAQVSTQHDKSSPDDEAFSVYVTSNERKRTMEEFLVGRLRSLLTSNEPVVYV